MALTPEEERLAAEDAETLEHLRTEDLMDWRAGPAAGRGRPSLTAPLTHSPTLHVRVPAGLYFDIEEEADERGITVSKLVREWLLARAEQRRRGHHRLAG